MVARLHHRVWHYALLLATGSVLFLWNLGGAGLWDIDEGKNDTCSWEMLDSGNYIIPTFNGLMRADKPVLLYWLQMAAYHAFGKSEFAARLPSALAALGAVLLAYELGRSLFGKSTGLLGGLIAATTPMLCGAARFANPDALLHFFTLLTLLVFWLGHRQRGALWWLSLGAATGFGMLAKGPVGFVLPAAVAFLFLLWEGRAKCLLDRRLGWTFLAFSLVALPWYVWVTVETKAAFLRDFLLLHNAGRFGSAMEGHAGSLFYYPLVLIVGTAPWSVFLIGALWCAGWSALRRPLTPDPSPERGEGSNPDPVSQRGEGRIARWRAWAADRQQVGHPEVAPGPESAYRFLLTWIATYLVFFTLAATKLPNYVLPVLVPSAIVTARFLDRWRRGWLSLPAWAMGAALVGLMLLGIGVCVGLILASGVGDLAVLRGRFVPGLAAWAWVGAGPLVGGLVAWKHWRQGRSNAVLACLTLAAVVLIAPMAAWGSVAFNHVKAPQPLVALSGAGQTDRDLRIGAWQLEHLPTLNFYVERDVMVVCSEKELAGLLRYPLPVYVFLPARAWEECRPATRNLGREIARRPDIYHHEDIAVITNQAD
jgi:4-amino-4-deoxy-L-arabinose transferase-like glycosyltransferase